MGEYDFFENTAYTYFIIIYDEKNVNGFEVFFVNVLYKCDYNFKKILLPPFQNAALYAIIELSIDTYGKEGTRLILFV